MFGLHFFESVVVEFTALLEATEIWDGQECNKGFSEFGVIEDIVKLEMLKVDILSICRRTQIGHRLILRF